MENENSHKLIYVSVAVFVLLLIGGVYLVNFKKSENSPARLSPSKMELSTDKFKYKIPEILSSTNITQIPSDQLPADLKGLIFYNGSNAALVVKKGTYDNNKIGYTMEYDYVLSDKDIKAYADQYPQLSPASVSKLTPMDIIGITIPTSLRNSGWQVTGGYRNNYTGFIEAENSTNKVRIIQTYKDFYTTRMSIQSISK